jgi:ribosome-associated protein YbcJ (S4-like RNA binding protein)
MNRSVTILAGMLFFAALPVWAQSQDSGSSAKSGTSDSSAPANSAPEKKKTKKVWTNDEIGKTGGAVSVVGEPGATDSETKKKPASAKDDFRQRQIDDYRNKLSKLQSQINAIDKRINQLKNFNGQNSSPSGGINIYQGYDMVPVPDQIKQLEAKKKELRAKMDDLETDAHKNGITAEDLH